MKKILFAIPLLILISTEVFSTSILIKPKQVLDVRTGKIINANILVESGVIKKVSENIKISDEFEVIDLSLIHI